VLFMLPELTAAEPLPAWAAHAPTIRLFDANVYESNSSMSGYISQLRSYRPTLLTMEEAVPSLVDQLKRSGVLDSLPYRIQLVRGDSKAFLIASKYPLAGENIVYFEGLPLIVQTTVKLPSGDQALWVVHTTAPLPTSFQQWQGQLATIDRYVRIQGNRGLLVVGDFNATWGSKGFRTILDDGLADAAAARGDPFEMTWSQMMPPLRPFARIDHVLTGPGVAVITVAVHAGPGSDHRAITATVATQPRPQ
jgi:endonuclease/exonuclease/phosphatase (EEP) superfamily protein YafD